jgi:ubiquinone/menaquinone biosynthesis C-methylase UbiE
MRYAVPGFAGWFTRTREIHDERATLFRAVRSIRDPSGLTVCEPGCGSGFWTEILVSGAKQVHAFDRSPRMIRAARRRLSARGAENAILARADLRSIPLPADSVDLVISAWVLPPFVYSCTESNWPQDIRTAVGEMRRICRAGGSIIMLTPSWRGPREYQRILRNDFGFGEKIIRCRWHFRSTSEAKNSMRLWFGYPAWNRWQYLWRDGVLVESSIWHLNL